MPKILTIVGARPQFVKAAALSRAFKKYEIKEVIVHTGQHFDENMAEIFFRQMEIPHSDYNLGINSLTHGAMTGRMLEETEKVMMAEKPSAVVVFGDTNSTLAGALAAAKLDIPVAHVEAGLRSFNMKMPEEINRILTDRISKYLFCPNRVAVKNLMDEGFDHFDAEMMEVGDVMFDVALYYSRFSAKQAEIAIKLDSGSKPLLLVTLHRQENTDNPERLNAILSALNELSRNFNIVLPLHPRTRKIIENQNIQLDFAPIDPVGYFDMIELLKRCRLVITDSGGLQKEAFFFKKHCLIIRDETEWTDLVEMKFNFLVGADTQKIIDNTLELKNANENFDVPLFGDGKAAEKIAQKLLRELK